MERTLAILKPDCVRNGHVGTVLSRIEQEGFAIRGMRMAHLVPAQARVFYAVHAGKYFFDGLIEFITSGPCVGLVLERDDAIAHWRRVMEPLRQALGTSQTQNLVHGSDAPETAAFECAFWFAGADLA